MNFIEYLCQRHFHSTKKSFCVYNFDFISRIFRKKNTRLVTVTGKKQIMNDTAIRDPSTANCRIYVGNLKENTPKNDLQNIFGKYGNVRGIMVSRNFGFIQFDSEQSANNAIENENQKMYNGRKIAVSKVQNKGNQKRPDKQGNMGGFGAGGGNAGGGGGGASAVGNQSDVPLQNAPINANPNTSGPEPSVNMPPSNNNASSNNTNNTSNNNNNNSNNFGPNNNNNMGPQHQNAHQRQNWVRNNRNNNRNNNMNNNSGNSNEMNLNTDRERSPFGKCNIKWVFMCIIA